MTDEQIKKFEKEYLVGKNIHSVYTYCINGCRTWGINMPQETTCGNCGEPNGLVYYDLETIYQSLQKYGEKVREDIKKDLEENLESWLADTPHKIVYEPKYPDELYVVSANYKKLAKQIIKKLGA